MKKSIVGFFYLLALAMVVTGCLLVYDDIAINESQHWLERAQSELKTVQDTSPEMYYQIELKIRSKNVREAEARLKKDQNNWLHNSILWVKAVVAAPSKPQ